MSKVIDESAEINEEYFESFVKHFWFSCEYGRGRIAVKFSWPNMLEIKQISGVAPPARLLIDILPMLGKEFLLYANKLHIGRAHGYAVEQRNHMSGSADIVVIDRRDDLFKEWPITGHGHGSMYGKLNYGVRIWLGDLPPVISYMKKNNFFTGEKVQAEEAAVEERNWADETVVDLLQVNDDGVEVVTESKPWGSR